MNGHHYNHTLVGVGTTLRHFPFHGTVGLQPTNPPSSHSNHAQFASYPTPSELKIEEGNEQRVPVRVLIARKMGARIPITQAEMLQP